MKKPISAALLAAAMLLTMALPAFATAPASVAEATQVVNALGIMTGDENGNMNLSNLVTRAEFITMAVKATPGGEQVGQAATSPYPDVSRSHWASGYVEAGVAAGLVSGYADGTFGPANKITLAEGATIVLQLLGYGSGDFSGAYPTGQLAMYRSLKLDRGIAASADTQLTRQDAMYLFYNLMTAKNKAGKVYLETLGHSLNAAGEIDLLALLNSAMEGPVVAQSNWQSSIPFDVNGATVYRNGGSASPSAIQNFDVVYYNQAMNTLWVYSDKVTGTIQALKPSAASPTSVTVAGRTCDIETSAATYALSSLGEYRLGDTVTLLLGRSGGVAAVTDGSAAAASERVGVVTSVDSATYPDGKGGTYTAQTVTMLSTDGQSYSYQHNSSGLRAGSLVRVTVSDQTGGVTLRTLSSASLSGKVNSAGTKVGNYSFASGVEILDVSDQYGVRIYPSRLAGLNLSGSMVRHYTLNSAGEIDRLILSDATGDMFQYGILTGMTETKVSEFSSVYTYELEVDGQTVTIPQSNVRYPVSTGPILIKGSPSAPERLLPLTSAKTGEISGGQFIAGNSKYTLSDSVQVYELRGGAYYLSSLSRAQSGDFTLTGWYDKAESAGGRLRVIVARAN